MKATRALIPMVVAQTCLAALSHAQSPNMIGTWKADITFTNGESRSLRFDAQSEGKGTFLLLDPKLNVWGPPSLRRQSGPAAKEARWRFQGQWSLC